MSQRAAEATGVYKFTSLARPVDPHYPTNRALLMLLPVLALASAGFASVFDLAGGAVPASLTALLTSFAGWALTRELAPDDDAAAFVALALAWFAGLFLGAGSVVLLFVALFLVRVVNRSTGLPARPLDTLAVLGFCIWAAITLGQGLILLLAATAFALDATLRDPLRRHFVAAAVCLAVLAWMLIYGVSLMSGTLTARDWLLIVILAAAALLVVTQTTEPISVCDVSPQPLDAVRVNAGWLLGFLLAVQALLTDGPAAWLETPIWACIVAVPISLLARSIPRPGS